MAKILSTFKMIRRNWKKSTFGALLIGYAASSVKRKYDINVFMNACCKEAEKFGSEPLPIASNPRTVTVILNPAANKRSAKEDYEKYCEPLLHLAGISVNLLLTNSVGHAKELVTTLPDNEPIVVAGGDGTLSETVTGILRQKEINNKRTIGILPVGRRNNIGNQLFPLSDSLPKVKQLTSATMAIIKDTYELKDVLKIEVKSNEDIKPIFALSGLEWGAFRDANARRDKYWIYGSLRDYFTYIFNGYKSSLNWNCKGTIISTPPCAGCKNCHYLTAKEQKPFRMLDLILPKTKEIDSESNFSNVSNDQCGSLHERPFNVISVSLSLTNGDSALPTHLSLNLGKPEIGYFQFIAEGWKRVNKSIKSKDEEDVIKARTIEIRTDNVSKEGAEVWYEIDNEEYDVKPIKISVLPKAINMYCSK